MGFPTGEESLRKNLGPMLDELGVGPDDDALAALRECEKPVYLKTHRLPDQIHYVPERGKKKAASNGEAPPGKDESPALYIVRDGRDAIVSFAHYLKEVRGRPKLQSMSIEEVIGDLVRRESPYGGWSGNVGAVEAEDGSRRRSSDSRSLPRSRLRRSIKRPIRSTSSCRAPVACCPSTCCAPALRIPRSCGAAGQGRGSPSSRRSCSTSSGAGTATRWTRSATPGSGRRFSAPRRPPSP